MNDGENSLLVQEYYKHTQYMYHMRDADYSYMVGNVVCWDSITVYIRIEKRTIVAYSYDGSPSLTTQAAAAFLWDCLIGEGIETILTRDADRIAQQWFAVSYRRRRSTVSALLGVRNCIHMFLWDDIQEEYDDVL